VSVKVSTESEKCVGSGQCVGAAPGVFDQDDEFGLVMVLNKRPTSDEENAVRHAANVCPAKCIHIEG
jgi:ferredoxin